MENLDDEKIQQLIEQQLREHKPDDLTGDSATIELYKMLFKELADNPITLSDSILADKLVLQLKRKQESAGLIYDGLVFTTGLLLIIGITYAAIAGMKTLFTNPLMLFLTAHKTAFLFILLTFISIRLLDSYLIKLKMR